MKQTIIILGAGSFGKVVADVAKQLGYEPIFLDDKSPLAIGPISDYIKFDSPMFPAIGNNELRLEFCQMLKQSNKNLVSLIHPTAYISPTAKLGNGVIVMPKAIINTNCIIRNGVIVNCGAIIDYDTVVEDGCHIGLGAVINGHNYIAKYSKVETGIIVERG